MNQPRKAEALQAISDYGPVLGLSLGRAGALAGSFRRLQDSLGQLVQSDDPAIRQLAEEALAAWNAREAKNIIPDWDRQKAKKFAELTETARTKLAGLYRALEIQAGL
jgi:hypothetical protein